MTNLENAYEYPVVEIFTSIQGEGVHMGKKATFIRLGECNLGCEWCDTDFSKSEKMTPDQIISKIYDISPKDPGMIVITGGEPTIHNLTELLQVLKYQGLYVAIETNGTNDVKREYGRLVDWIACSPKPQNNYDIHPGAFPDELKYVVDDHFDVCVVPKIYRTRDFPIWLQPEGYHMHESAKRAYQLTQEYSFLRLGLQLHKIFELK